MSATTDPDPPCPHCGHLWRHDARCPGKALTAAKELQALINRAYQSATILDELGQPFSGAAVRDALDALESQRDAVRVETFPVRPEVAAFALRMEAKLRANEHKPGWKGDNPVALVTRLYQEANELLDAVQTLGSIDRDPTEVTDEAADVANFAMMVADVCGGLKATPPPSSDALCELYGVDGMVKP